MRKVAMLTCSCSGAVGDEHKEGWKNFHFIWLLAVRGMYHTQRFVKTNKQTNHEAVITVTITRTGTMLYSLQSVGIRWCFLMK